MRRARSCPHPYAMNIEQARFNMIEQQIRPWDVLDTRPCSNCSPSSSAKTSCRAPTARWPSSTPKCRCRVASACSRRRSKRACCRSSSVQRARARARDRCRLGLHGRAARAPRAARDHARDRPRTGRAGARATCAAPACCNATVRRTPMARRACPADGPFDAIMLSGSVAEVPHSAAGPAEGRAAASRPSSASCP